ncbi:Rix1 complex component [Lipomyces arxii]|uniref:Rix1 complex component n=1 Tax=Lipomyces arxii TaxID=56418 RepID=UPI0034CD2F61
MVSQKKKKDKRKDFTKTKLKVGKTKPKSTTHTELGFRAKAIDIRTQSITRSYSTDDAFAHHLSLTKHNSNQTRRDTLLYIQTHLPNDLNATLFTAIAPLVIDPSQSVRTALLSLFQKLPAPSLVPHIHILSLYIHSGMTHLSADIRADSSRYLLILLKADDASIPMHIVTRTWAKTLTCLGSLLGWEFDRSSFAPVSRKSKLSKGVIGNAASIDSVPNASGHLDALATFLRLGLSDHTTAASKADRDLPVYHVDTAKHMIPRNTTSPFSRLGLFEAGDGKLSIMSSEDIGARYRIVEPMLDGIFAGLESGRREGGEIGRTCKHLIDFLRKTRREISKSQ